MEIKFLNLSHTYQGLTKNDLVGAVKDVNLTIEEKDEFVAICGRTGSGKSTLIQHINGLLLPTAGSIDILGSILTPKKRKNPKLTPIRKRIGFVFQFPEYQLFEETVLKDIMFAPKNFGESEEKAKAQALEVSNLLGIPKELLKKSPFNLSGGQMRKVAIAGILSYNPDVLILDEPTRGLDPEGAREIVEIFYKIHKQMHKTIILISHDMNVVYQYATRIICMKDGSLSYDGKKEELFKSDKYQEYDLDKPHVLKAVDYLNEKLNLNLDYNIYTLDDLIKRLEVEYHE